MLKRRSLLPQTGLNDSLNASIPIAEVDEDAERRGRVRIQRRQSLGPVRPVAGNLPDGTPVTPIASSTSGYSASQLADHYANCMKLSAENKINVKNAFSLGLIDYMAEMVRKKAPGMDNFQAASCALDASAKIYGYRVDSLHTDTLKLAGGVGKTAQEAGVAAGGGADGDQNEEVDVNGIPKKVRKKRNAGATIEKNLNNINLSKFDLEFDVDPLFKKTSAQFDSGGGGGKFLCNLLTRDDSCQLLLDSNAIQFMPGEKGSSCEDKINNNFVWPKKWPTKLDDDTLTICPEFVTFRFLDWSLEKEDADSSFLAPTQKTNADPLNDDNEHAFDVNAPVDFDDDGIGADFVGSDDPFDNADDGNGDVFMDDKREENRAGVSVNKGMTDVEHLKRHLSYIPSEYSYFDSGRLGSWRGPQHWKFSRPKFTSTNPLPGAAKPKNNKSKEPTPHDFKTLYTNEFKEENLTYEQVIKAMTVPKLTVKLQPKTMNTWSEDKLLMPTDLFYSGQDFAKLYHGDFHIATKPVKLSMSVDDSVTDYDFNNENDVSNFCPDVNTEGGGYDDDDGGDMGVCDDGDTANGDGGINTSLVAAPNRVEKIAIGYAKQAKKMDMRRLKSIEWELLTSRLINNDKENEEMNNTMNVGKEDVVKPVAGVTTETSFGKLYKELHHSKKMPMQMAENLSVPLAFVALLHLCNENNLALESIADLSDFKIRQG